MKNKIFIFIGILIIIFSILFIKTDFFKNKSIPEAYNIDKKVYLEKKDSKYFYKDLVLNKDQSILLTSEGEKFSFGKDKEIILKIYGYPLRKRFINKFFKKRKFLRGEKNGGRILYWFTNNKVCPARRILYSPYKSSWKLLFRKSFSWNCK